jgi:hypothetical protein
MSFAKSKIVLIAFLSLSLSSCKTYRFNRVVFAPKGTHNTGTAILIMTSPELDPTKNSNP